MAFLEDDLLNATVAQTLLPVSPLVFFGSRTMLARRGGLLKCRMDPNGTNNAQVRVQS